MIYRLIAFILGMTGDIFYRRITLGHAVPDEGPVLILANHPNALADPVVLARITPRPQRALAKEPLFHFPVFSWVLRGVGAIPVFRAQDGFDTTQNDRVFDAVLETLEKGEVITLFPEGISHDLPGLQPLKTGAARMAMRAVKAGGEAAKVRIVPVGLTFRDKPAFRSDVLIHIGESISAADYVASLAAGISQQDAVRKLNQTIFERIQSLIIDLEHWEDVPLVELAALLSTGGKEDPLMPVRMTNAAKQLQEQAPRQLTMMKEKLEKLSSTLRERGLDGSHLSLRFTPAAVLMYLVRNVLAFLLGTPIAVVGALLYGIPYLILRWLPFILRVVPDAVATVRIFGAVALLIPWQFALSAWLHSTLPMSVALTASIVLPFTGLYAHAYARRRKKMWQDGRAFLHLLLRPRLRKHLHDEKRALEQELHEVASRFSPLST